MYLFEGPKESTSQGVLSLQTSQRELLREHHALDGGSQDLSHSEHDDSSEKQASSRLASREPRQRPPHLVSAISGWVQFEDDAPRAAHHHLPKEAGGTGRPGEGLGRIGMEICASQGCFPKERSVGAARVLLCLRWGLGLAAWETAGRSLLGLNSAPCGRIYVFWAISSLLPLFLAVHLSLEGCIWIYILQIGIVFTQHLTCKLPLSETNVSKSVLTISIRVTVTCGCSCIPDQIFRSGDCCEWSNL